MSERIRVTDRLSLDPDELSFTAIRASGPGGQNVNKVSNAVQLRFDAAASASLPAQVRERLIRLAGRRATGEGVIVLTAQRHRSQERNREDAVARLVALIAEAAIVQPPRRPTRPSAGAKARRLEAKSVRAGIKSARARPRLDD
ncbi:alternative ribosome rescue aminoacyl-tRNA hydrolase ArfB [Elioraea rosea]|uniref:alternative ribosome rescue aminoacyl-tRNA hydrolase ArfB n=1 Tax=Elioraea rosea TaxID=2492390 RepID=UPI001951F45B|nr:alternative ribosome rescue aminoacyl-tRNA hydrolase ArfB [Elioraea rosea]